MILPCYLHILFAYFASFIGYEDDFLEVISNLHVQRAKFGGKRDKFGGKSFKQLNSAEFMEFGFTKYEKIWALQSEKRTWHSFLQGQMKLNLNKQGSCTDCRCRPLTVLRAEQLVFLQKSFSEEVLEICHGISNLMYLKQTWNLSPPKVSSTPAKYVTLLI